MKINRTDITRVYYVEDGSVPYKVIHTTMNPVPHWRPNANGEDWKVFASQGIHTYQRLCDPDKPTHKRVVAAVQSALNERVPV